MAKMLNNKLDRTTWVMPAFLALVLLAGHASLCWKLIGGWRGIHSPYPILTDDFTFNFYSAVITREFLRQSGSTAGYDPNFMAGYAKSIIWPSSSTLAELIVFIFGGDPF